MLYMYEVVFWHCAAISVLQNYQAVRERRCGGGMAGDINKHFLIVNAN